MKFNYHYVLAKKFNHRQYSASGNEYSGIIYHDDLPPLTQAQFDKADLELQQVQYLELRKEEYPKDKEKTHAMWEKICNENDQPLKDLKLKMEEVDKKYPPPQ